MGILRLSVLGRKWYGRTGLDGAGDWELGEGAVDEADFGGSGVGFLGVDAAEDLVILPRRDFRVSWSSRMNC